MKTKAMFTMAILALLLTAPLPARAERATGIEDLVVELASTPAQHAAVAGYFGQRAEAARAEAARHEAMKRSYAVRNYRVRANMRGHCDRLIEHYGALAAQYDTLAAEHALKAGSR